MKRVLYVSGAVMALCALTGCKLPGKPKPGVPLRPEQVTDFQVLYRQNCAACHGTEGKGGAAVALADPEYIAYAGTANIQTVTANGIPGSLMPAFAKGAGGLLTDQQIAIVARGIAGWASPQQVTGLRAPVYQSHAAGNVARGEALYQEDCLHCHVPGRGSVLDPVYLSLISNGGLRTILVTGRPREGMPDWRGYAAGPLTDQQLADLVTFLTGHRSPALQPAGEAPSPAGQKANTP